MSGPVGFTYSGDPANSDADTVRFLLGDTDPSAFFLNDSEIAFLLSTVHSIGLSNPVLQAAAAGAEAIASKLSREITYSADGVSVSADTLVREVLHGRGEDPDPGPARGRGRRRTERRRHPERGSLRPVDPPAGVLGRDARQLPGRAAGLRRRLAGLLLVQRRHRHLLAAQNYALVQQAVVASSQAKTIEQ